MFKILHNPSGTNKLILEDTKNSYFLKYLKNYGIVFNDSNKILNNGSDLTANILKITLEGPYFVEYTFNNF